MRVLLVVAVVTVLNNGECGPGSVNDAQVKQQQQLVNLCEERGGIPVMEPNYGAYMLRCDFPPVAPIIKLPESGR